MKKFLLGAAAMVVTGAALAQAPAPMAPMAPVSPAARMAPMARGMDRVETRNEVVAKVREHFAMLDTNRDGLITAEEMGAMHGQQRDNTDGMRATRGDHMAMRGGAMGDPNAMFDRLDTNRDGQISRDEFGRAHEMRAERQVAINQDGRGAPEAPGMADQHGPGMMEMHHMGGMGSHMLKMADLNRDGRVSLQEMTDSALQRFDQADTNRDGRISPEERQAMHQRMMQEHGRNGG
jgi:Ca2+-binding EF-hand superfamily protein